MAIPTIDTELVAYGSNFDQKATLSPTTYALTAPQALAFHTAYTAFLAAYNAVAAAHEAGARDMALTSAKDDAKAALLKIGRELYTIVQSSNTVSDGNKQTLGVRVRSVSPSVVPVPAQSPALVVRGVDGNTVSLRLVDKLNPTRKGKPVDADGAAVFSFVGAAAPTEESAWKFEGLTTRTAVDITFPPGTTPGAKVWFTAAWFNGRKQQGPAAASVTTNLPGGAAMAA